MGLLLLLGWYAVLGIAAFVALVLTQPRTGWAFLVAPIAAVAAVVVAPVTLAILAQGRRRRSPFALATLSASAGVAFVAASTLAAAALT